MRVVWLYTGSSYQLESCVVLSHRTVLDPREMLKQMAIPSVPWRVQWATREAILATSVQETDLGPPQGHMSHLSTTDKTQKKLVDF